MIRFLRGLPMLHRTLLFTALAAVIVLALFAYMGSDALDNSLREKVDLEVRYIKFAADQLNSQLTNSLGLLETAAGQQSVFLPIPDLSPVFDRFMFQASLNGTLYSSKPRISEARAALVESALAAFEDTDRGGVSGFLIDPVDGSTMILFVYPIRDERAEPVGWLGGAKSIDSFSIEAFAENLELTEESRTFLLDRNGTVLLFHEGLGFERVFLPYHDRYLPIVSKRAAEIVELQLPGKDGSETRLVAFAPVPIASWVVVVDQPEAAVFETASTLRWQFVIVGALLMASTLAFAWLVDELVVRPVRDLFVATKRLANGDLETPIHSEGRDETAQLAQELEAMRGRLSDWGGELSRAVERQTHRLSTLYAIDQVASKTLDLGAVLEVSLNCVVDLTKADAAAVLLLEREDVLQLEMHRNLPQAAVDALSGNNLEEQVIGECVRKKCVVFSEDKESDSLSESLRKMGFRQEVSTPLVAKDKALGALALFYKEEAAVRSAEEEDLLTSIGRQIGSAVHNAQLFVGEQQRREEAETLYEAARAIGTPISMREVLARILSGLQRVIPFDQAAVLLLESEQVRVIGGRGRSAEEWLELLIDPADTPPVKKVLDLREPVCLPRGLRGELFPPAPGEKDAGVWSWLGVPLTFGDRLLGLIALEKSGENYFTGEHTRLAAAFASQTAALIENSRLFQQLETHLARISAFYELGADILSAGTPEETALVVAKKVTQSAHAHSATVTLIDGNGNIGLRMGADEKGALPSEPPPRPNGSTMRVWKNREILTATNSEKGSINAQLLERGVCALIGLPLRASGGVLGTLFVRYADPHVFNEDEVRTLTTFANMAATALERVRLLEETRRRLEEVEALFDLSNALREANSLSEMLPLLCGKAIRIARADAAGIFLLEGGGAVCKEAEGFRGEMIGSRVPLEEGIIGATITSGELQQKPFVQGGRLLAASPGKFAVVHGVGCDLCLPLRTSDSILGALRLVSIGRAQFDKQEIRLLTTIADFAGSAIHRVMLFEQLNHRIRELGSLYEVGKAVTNSLRLEDVISQVMDSAPRAVRAGYGFLFLWDDDEMRLVLRAISGGASGLVGESKYQSGEGLAGWVYLEKRPALLPDVESDPRWKPDPELESLMGSEKIRDLLAVPLLRGNKALGVLQVANRTGAGTFSEADQSLLAALAGQTAIAIENAMLFEDVRGLSINAISSLATAIDARDPYTRGHSEGVTRLVVQLARRLGWEGADLEMLEYAALLHDVGKIAVPDSILRKPSSLLPDEWDIMILHPYHSTQIIRPVRSLRRIVPWIYHHHERWDGKGYPDRLGGNDIPEGARILSVADSYNAMTTDRPYRQAMPVEEALEEIRRCAGHQFDPVVADALVAIIREGSGKPSSTDSVVRGI